jgi:hypothetical protein
MSLPRQLFSGLTLSLLATAACGDEPSKQFADAPTIDARTADAAPDAAVPGIVKAVAVRYGQIIEGATVIFQNADGSTISTKLTDATGEASETMLPGGIVNIVLAEGPVLGRFAVRGGPANEVVSFLGVKPGDVLRTGDASPNLTFATREFTLPTLPPGAFLNIMTSCGNNGVLTATPPITVSLDAACTTTSVFVSIRDPMNLSIGSFYKANVTVPATGPINLSAETFAADRQLDVAVNNTPADVSSLVVTGSLSDGRLEYASADNSQFSPSPVLAANAGVVTISGAVGPDLLVRTGLNRGNNGYQEIFELAAPAAAYALSLTGQVLPWVDTFPALNIATGEVTWTETPGDTPEAIQFRAYTFRADTKLSFARTVIAPYRMGAVKIPKLPGTAAQFDFLATDAPSLGIALVKVGVGYDLLRPLLSRTYGTTALQGQRGRVRFSYSQFLD